jgi:ABC-2 type transport system permease protein
MKSVTAGSSRSATDSLELIGAGAVGRYAPLAASLTVALVADVVIGVLVGAGLTLLGLPAGGSFVLGLALAAVGAAFAGISAITAQLTETGRAATGIAATVLGGTFLLRAIGDSAGGDVAFLSWLSPMGWGQQVRPFAGDRLWVFAVLVGCTVGTVVIAAALVARRDLGEGMWPSRPGRPVATAALRGPFALAWRLQRGVLLGWLAAFGVLGGVFGALTHDMISVVTGNPTLSRIIGRLGGVGGIADAFLSSIMGLLGLIAAIFTVQAVLRLRAEETAQRAEPVLATGTGRVPYALAHLVVAGLGGALLLAAGGVMAGLAYGLRAGDVGGQLPRVLEAALVQVPATWVLAGVAMALFGFLPAVTGAGWAAVVGCFLLGELGPSLNLPSWVLDVSPFTHVPKLPGGTFSTAAVGWLILVGVGLAIVGLVGFGRRDIG